MTYWNLIEHYGPEAFARDLAAAGGSGLITPDLTPDEADDLVRGLRRPRARPRVPRVAVLHRRSGSPTPSRACRGWVYATSVMGVTGRAVDELDRGPRPRRAHPRGGARGDGRRRARRVERGPGARDRRLRRRRDRRVRAGQDAARRRGRRRRRGTSRPCGRSSPTWPQGVAGAEADGAVSPLVGLAPLFIPSPEPQRLAPRAAAAAGVRAVHHRRDRRRHGHRDPPLAGARRHLRRAGVRRRARRALRHRRGPDLPRHHRLRALLRPRPQPGRRAEDLAGRPRHLGRGRARRARRLAGRPAARDPLPGAAGRLRPRPRRGPGDRPARQLVQLRALRPADDAALGPGDRAAGSARPASSSTRRSTRRSSTS